MANKIYVGCGRSGKPRFNVERNKYLIKECEDQKWIYNGKTMNTLEKLRALNSSLEAKCFEKWCGKARSFTMRPVPANTIWEKCKTMVDKNWSNALLKEISVLIRGSA